MYIDTTTKTVALSPDYPYKYIACRDVPGF
jgi:hypothetical protein